jgi:hypothetical protein
MNKNTNTTQINNNTKNSKIAKKLKPSKPPINWSKYNHSLEQRGDFTVLLSITGKRRLATIEEAWLRIPSLG